MTSDIFQKNQKGIYALLNNDDPFDVSTNMITLAKTLKLNAVQRYFFASNSLMDDRTRQ